MPTRYFAWVLLLLLSGCSGLATKQEQTPPEPGPASEPPTAELVCPELEPCVCPVCPKVELAKVPAIPTEKKVIGEIENVTLSPDNLIYPARIDTGATTTSIHATDITRFERDGERWVRYTLYHPKTGEPMVKEDKQIRRIRIKNAEEGFDSRRVVMMTLTLGKITRQVQVSLVDRSRLEFPLLIGRNFLVDLMVVDVSQRNIANSARQTSP